ncbi:hypothetical protein ACWGNE_02215 [Streptomyces xiamenensis]
MTAYLIGYEVGCDGPAAGADCPTAAALLPHLDRVSPTEVRAYGREHEGWVRHRREGQLVDLCPDCRTGVAA